jgi:hypothetical protein
MFMARTPTPGAPKARKGEPTTLRIHFPPPDRTVHLLSLSPYPFCLHRRRPAPRCTAAGPRKDLQPIFEGQPSRLLRLGWSMTLVGLTTLPTSRPLKVEEMRNQATFTFITRIRRSDVQTLVVRCSFAISKVSIVFVYSSRRPSPLRSSSLTKSLTNVLLE